MSDIDWTRSAKHSAARVRPADSAQFGQFGPQTSRPAQRRRPAHRVADPPPSLKKERREHLATQNYTNARCE